MLHSLEITFPFFALVLCGYAIARRGWLPLDSIPGLNVFVLHFALPCMPFRFAATVLALVAALPGASNFPMLAERFGADAGRIARIVLVSTGLAFLSVSAAVAQFV